MKTLAAAIFCACLLAAAGDAAAEGRSIKVCAAVTLSASTTTDCTIGAVANAYPEIIKFKFFSFQINCGETTDNSMSIDVDWIAGSAAGTEYVGIPKLSDGTAMTQLLTAYTTEDAWSVLQSIQPPVSPVGTLRFTENNGDADIVCTAILNVGD
jgi:hypothetical protein